MKMKRLPAGLLVLFLTVGLTSCASQPDALPPQIHKQTIAKRVALPAECFQHVDVSVVSRGDTNEDLARAYRDTVDSAVATNERLDECFEKNGSTVE